MVHLKQTQLSLSFKNFHNYITKNFLKNAINFVISFWSVIKVSLLYCIKLTPFWSLSSTAVAPRRIKSFSIFSATSSIISSRSALTEFLASVNSSLNLLYSSSSSSRYANSKVLKPALAYSLACSWVCSSNSLPFFASLSNMTLLRNKLE